MDQVVLTQSNDEVNANSKFAMRLSLGVGVFMLVVKMYAYIVTGSAAILSDAAESVVHILAISFAAYSLWLSLKPADDTHLYGHDRISFFSAGFEGAMIILAAIYIIVESILKWIQGLQIENIEQGIYFTVAATIINGALGGYLLYRGKKNHSLILEANGKHVLTDSWTSLGVIVGLLLTKFTGWLPFDPLVAIVVAINILWTGGNLIRQSIGGLMDEADPEVGAKLQSILQTQTQKFNIGFHHLRHRNAGNKLLIEFHLLFPDNATIADAHLEATVIEQEIKKAFPMQTEIISHLEPSESHDEVHAQLLNARG
ncbi:MAG: cation transporter [Ignavibacteriae bacterium]|nr:cation transporter [Ignavibacteriota bacterium]